MKFQFHKVALGGTFDHFHDGHRKLVSEAFRLGEKVVIGVTSDSFASSKYQVVSSKRYVNGKNKKPLILATNYSLLRHAERKKEVQDYLERKDWTKRCKIIELHDVHGPTLTDSSFDAIVVSPETEKVALEINNQRITKGYSELFITVVPWVLADDKEPIHSSRIRAGEIGRNGTMFRLSQDWGARKLPESLRQQFKSPMGEFFLGSSDDLQEAIVNFSSKYLVSPASPSEAGRASSKYNKKNPLLLTTDYSLLIAVGDRATHAFNDAGIMPDVAIIDYHVERERRYTHITELGFSGKEPVIRIKNPRGTLCPESFRTIKATIKAINENKAQKKSGRLRKILSSEKYYRNSEVVHDFAGSSQNDRGTHIIEVDGEEDLFVLPAILMAPLGTLVVYGQPNVVSLPEQARIKNQESGIKVKQLRTLNYLPAAAGRSVDLQAGELGTGSGIVVVEVTEDLKYETLQHLSEFTKSK